MPTNDNPFAPWNSPMNSDNPFAPHNNPMYSDDPSKPWNNPFGSEMDLTNDERNGYGLPRRRGCFDNDESQY
jgi:hypothetical protein